MFRAIGYSQLGNFLWCKYIGSMHNMHILNSTELQFHQIIVMKKQKYMTTSFLSLLFTVTAHLSSAAINLKSVFFTRVFTK